jgi:transposase
MSPDPDPTLFPADDSGAVRVDKPELGGVDKTFRPYQPNQILLMPPSLDEWLPESHLSRFVSELVDETLDLDAIYASYIEKRGYPPYDPRMMVKLLIYGYTTGHRSSRGIERRCLDDVAFRYLAGGDQPDHRSIARFRRRHLGALAGFFLQALELCKKAGMVRLGQVAVDGTKLRANASRRKAMSYRRMVKREPELEAEIAAILAEAEKVDTAEDARLGKDNRDDDLPGELARRETRLARIRKAKSELEAEAQQAAAEKARKQGMTEAQVEEAAAEAAAKAVPKDKAQRNFTDPESRIMKTSDGSFHQCYNGQAAVDAEHQIIVAADLDACAADSPQLLPMLDAVIKNTGGVPDQFLADAGYCSESNLEGVDKREVDAYISTRRQKHNESDEPPSPAELESATPSRRERMALKLRTAEGKRVYARRKAIVEPVFGQMGTLQAMRHLLLRGEEQALGEWLLTCGCHNLRKLFNYRLVGFQGAGNGQSGPLAAA